MFYLSFPKSLEKITCDFKEVFEGGCKMLKVKIIVSKVFYLTISEMSGIMLT
ncbi:hypothetical protein MYP_3437 [Sporocytophaga myxococcoides]|uniref:Uncharacterized protein n=1 Tax=Sporocytophaga myxococcoides TaxID=153721 RepID=A0A098LJ76_9BACT|nr:hypothetical protein MYP_3437 [Sporocytophaga myxococcoides]